MGTVASYLKWALLLIQNCLVIPTDTMGLINKVMVSADYDEFTGYMTSIYFASKRESLVGGYMEYLDTAKAEQVGKNGHKTRVGFRGKQQ